MTNEQQSILDAIINAKPVDLPSMQIYDSMSLAKKHDLQIRELAKLMQACCDGVVVTTTTAIPTTTTPIPTTTPLATTIAPPIIEITDFDIQSIGPYFAGTQNLQFRVDYNLAIPHGNLDTKLFFARFSTGTFTEHDILITSSGFGWFSFSVNLTLLEGEYDFKFELSYEGTTDDATIDAIRVNAATTAPPTTSTTTTGIPVTTEAPFNITMFSLATPGPYYTGDRPLVFRVEYDPDVLPVSLTERQMYYKIGANDYALVASTVTSSGYGWFECRVNLTLQEATYGFKIVATYNLQSDEALINGIVVTVPATTAPPQTTTTVEPGLFSTVFHGYLTSDQDDIIDAGIVSGLTYPEQVLVLSPVGNRPDFPTTIDCPWHSNFTALQSGNLDLYRQFVAVAVADLPVGYTHYQNMDLLAGKGLYADKGSVEEFMVNGELYKVFVLDETLALNYSLGITSF